MTNLYWAYLSSIFPVKAESNYFSSLSGKV